MLPLEPRLKLFLSLLIVAYSCLGLGMWMLKRWRMRRRIISIADTGNEKESLLHKATEQLAGLFSSSQEEVAKKMVEAGFYNTAYAHLFMPLKYLLLIAGELTLFVLYLQEILASDFWVMGSALWLVAVVSLPDLYLAMRRKTLIRKLSSKMPYLLDLMAVCVQTGMTIEASIKYLCKEMKGFDKDLAFMLNRLNDRAQLVGLEQALDELQSMITSNEISSFAMTLNQSLRYGSSIYQVLTTLAADIREMQMLGVEEKIGKLAAKMSIPLIIFIMIPIVILIAAPGVMRVLSDV
ncbi:type II secretion system F family protein [Vibrio sp. JC009]|uniref:type II secretion system F family protein n=1 Tax=Vibrio sp. JC009 TaxID=2912314 RepID=UPI0023AE7631|nr:type II secretion system F family protein [Vibrio sp. JC009]WED22302.1 type II secretion system F family protein [Vibrio sp. JC009]